MKPSNLLFLSFLICCTVHVFTKPALNEENRNLCEDDPDKAECLREVEEAKAGTVTAGQQEESTQEQQNAESSEETPEEYHARIEKVYKNSEENRKFWREELRTMNKWEKYGLT